MAETKVRTFEFQSSKHQISLNITGLSQNKSKQDVWKFNLIIDGINVTTEYFGKNNNLNFYLDYFQFVSDKSDFVFIPSEGTSLLINTKTLKKIYLPFIEKSTELFFGSSWRKKYHMAIFNNCVYITDLKTGETFPLSFENDIIIYAGFSEDEQIMIEHYNRKTKVTKNHMYDISTHNMTEI